MNNKILLMTCFFLSLTTSAHACGDYNVHALVVIKDGLSALVINPKTRSEMNLKVEMKESLKLSPYNDRFIEASVEIPKEIDATLATVTSIKNIKVIVPDPLAPDSGTKIILLKNKICKK